MIEYNGVQMDLGKPFERITMVDAVKKYAGVDWNEVETLEQARALAKEHHVEFEERHKKEISLHSSSKNLQRST